MNEWRPFEPNQDWWLNDEDSSRKRGVTYLFSGCARKCIAWQPAGRLPVDFPCSRSALICTPRSSTYYSTDHIYHYLTFQTSTSSLRRRLLPASPLLFSTALENSVFHVLHGRKSQVYNRPACRRRNAWEVDKTCIEPADAQCLKFKPRSPTISSCPRFL